MAPDEAICAHTHTHAGGLDIRSVSCFCRFVWRAGDGERERARDNPHIRFLSWRNSRSGVLVRSAEFMCCSGPERRGEERRGQTNGAGRWNISHNHSVKWWRVFQVEETSAPSAFSEVWWSVTLADWRKLSGRESWFDVCLVVVSVLPPFHAAICALTACVRVPSGRVCVLMYTCICASVCIMHVCVLLLYLPLGPSLYCTTLSFPSHCSAGESAAGARRKSSSLVGLKGKANSEMHKHRKCCFPHSGSSWASFSVFRSPPSRLLYAFPPHSTLITGSAQLHT